MLAYSTDVVGDERYTIRVKDLATGEPARRDRRRHRRRHLGPGRARTSTTRPSTTPGAPTRSGGTGSAAARARTSWSTTRPTSASSSASAGPAATASWWSPPGPRPPRSTASSTPTPPTPGFQVFAERRGGHRVLARPRGAGRRGPFLVLHNATGPDFELGIAPIAPTARDDWKPLLAHDEAVRLENVDAFAGHLVVHQRSRGLTQLRILELGDEHAAAGDRRLPGRVRPRDLHRRLRQQPGLRPADRAARLHDDGRALVGLRLRRADPRADAAQAGAGPGRLRPGRLRGAPALGHRRGRRAGADLDRARRDARADGPDARAALRLRRLRDVHRPLLLGRPPLAARPRCGVRDRARARRRRDGPALVRRRQDAGQAAHVLRLRRLRPAPRREPAGPPPDTAGRRGRQRRRPAGRRRGQPGAGAVRRDRGRGPVRGRPDHDARREPAADGHRVRRVGQPGGRRRTSTTTSRRTRPTTTSPRRPTRRSWPRPRSTTPGCSTSSPPSGSPGCGPSRSTATDVLLRTEMSAGHGGVSGRYKAWKDRAFTLAWILDRMGLAEASGEHPVRRCDESAPRVPVTDDP